MKKALIVLLILGLAGGLFAQSWSGSVSTGARIDFGEDTPIKSTADGDDDKAVKASVSYKGSSDDWGFTVGTSAKVDRDNNALGLTIGDFNGWVKFADMFKLTVGKGIGDAWTTGDNTGGKVDNGGNIGYRLEITPAAVSGLNFGFRFAYPSGKTAATTIANFFQETGIGAKYSADVWNVAAGIDLVSEEAGGLDGNAYAGFNYTGLGDYLSLIHVGAKINNTFDKAADQAITLFERLSGSVVGLNWTLDLNEAVTASPLAVGIELGLDYGITISDKTSATIGADADAKYADEFKLGGWDIWAQLNYKFNGGVSTSAKFELDSDFDFSEVTPWLRWLITYSF
jgi:hypothetical protein